MYTRKLITAPAAEPITVAQAKAHLRVDHTDDDAVLLPRLIAAAREHLEKITSRAFITQTWELYLEHFPHDDEIHLPFGSLQAVTAFSWTDSGGTTSTWSPSGANLLEGSVTRAHVNNVEEPGEIILAYSQQWPTATLKTSNPITIRFVCGYGADDTYVPAPLKQAMLLTIGHLYDHRSEVEIGQAAAVATVPMARGVDALIENYRLYW